MYLCGQNVPVVQNKTSDRIFSIVLDAFLKSDMSVTWEKASNVPTA